MNISGRDVNDSGNRSPQIEHGIDFDCCLGRAKVRLRKRAQAKIDRRGIKRVNGLVQLHAEGMVRVKTSGFADEMLGQNRHTSAKVDARWREPACCRKPSLESPSG